MNREEPDQASLKVAIDRCSQEPLQFIGKIQDYGALIVLNESLRITHISENIQNIFNKEATDILSHHIEELIDYEILKKLLPKLHENAHVNHLRFNLYNIHKRNFCGVIHKYKNRIIIELEPLVETNNSLNSFDQTIETLNKFSDELVQYQEKEDLFKILAKWIKNIGEFSRVKIYIFDENWNGTVVEEIKDPHMPSYLNMKFPHSDIPEPARLLYTKNSTRMITNVNSQPIKIIGNIDESCDVDLTYTHVRSVSPVHLQYLKNMDVNSSYSISLLNNFKLFGLVACHNKQVHFVEYSKRKLLQTLVNHFSTYYSLANSEIKTKAKSQKRIKFEQIKLAIQKSNDVETYLKNNCHEMMNIIAADTIIVRINDQVYSSGSLPESKSLENLFFWYQNECKSEIFISYNLPNDLKNKQFSKQLPPGLIILPIDKNRNDLIIWQRHEIIQEEDWVGTPEKVIAKDDLSYYLTPRSSFKRVKHELKGFSKKWSLEDINLAKKITEAILQKKFQDAINQKTNDLTSILNHSNACIYITNLSANILNINSEACLCFQIYKNCSGQPLFNFIKDKNFQSNFTKSLKLIQKTKKAISIEEEVNLNGESHFFTTVRFPLFNHNSQIYSVCTISSSINKLKKNEKKLKFINKELDSMSYFLAHDLSRPIRHISNYANLIIDELKENNIENTQIYEYIAHIIKSNEYLIKMIESILVISKIEEQCNTTFLENPIEIIKDIFDDYQNTDKNTSASLEFHGDLPPLDMSYVHFRILFDNLISNSFKYKKNFLKLEIKIFFSADEHKVHVKYVDNGIGIPEHDLRNIFNFFKRGSNVGQLQGAGIGLTQIKKLILKYNEKIDVYSKEDEGVTFMFTLPKLKK